MKKLYYKCEFRQLSPLRIGTGSGEKTDNDLAKDSRGFPVIPGTSLAGVLRNLLSPQDANTVFGYVTGGDNAKAVGSGVLVSDATLPVDATQTDFRISQRDGVGLSDNGTAKPHAKYDFEVVECDLPYTAILELADDADAEKVQPLLEGALCQAMAHNLRFGARSTRGFGLVSVSVCKREFSFPAQFDEWLVFDPQTDRISDPLPDGETAAGKQAIQLDLTLVMQGSFSVRVYTTAMVPDNETSVPDQIALENRKGEALIPGTSWAGSFRHHMRHLARNCCLNDDVLTQIDELFGVKANAKEKKRSEISFTESAVHTKNRATMTRNAIDRYTNAPRNQALFTTRVARGGEGHVSIQLPAEASPTLLRLLAAAVNDLSLGLMTLGGEAGVGRGICSVTEAKVNGIDKTAAMAALRTDYLLGGEA